MSGPWTITIRPPRYGDARPCTALAALVLGEERAGAFVQSHLERHHLLVAEAGTEVVGVLAYRADWFQCTLVALVAVSEGWRRRGIARELFRAVEALSPTPRLFSSAAETDGPAIRMHRALGFKPSGHIDNLPRGARELLFYKRAPPRGADL